VKKETIKSPKPSTALSPNLSTNFPEIKPEENLIIANAETINPIAVLFTPKEEAKIGMAGIIKPNPIATKNETVERIATSRGRSRNGFSLFNLILI
jgi:hypothetical protein